ncbi:MAG TPA: phospholipid carrier-dependent glycosyltransferase [Acidobacteriaceae bacterium]|jgi:4-amino-4-deoxy-L-arabinose transferase-like glycosyltransferase|nr:phospholipid carrier-dependent glycosyltransferase [Acidobacteriaceae bacterium]
MSEEIGASVAAAAGATIPRRGRWTLLWVVVLWAAFYASFALVRPALLDDADSVHAEVAREMLLRHDYVTLHANGIRYLEKAPLLYWAMAAGLKAFGAVGLTGPTASTTAVRLPLALTVLALALFVESFARRMFHSARAGMYAALILLSSFGIFIFTRITIPDAMVCLWMTTAMLCFWRTEAPAVRRTRFAPGDSREDGDADVVGPGSSRRVARAGSGTPIWGGTRIWCWGFAASCALNVLTKGLIGVVFPVATVVIYLLLTRGWKRTWVRVGALCPWSSLAVFLVIAAPWHVMAGLANPGQGHPTPFHFVGGHWIVPLPTDGNVRGWFWFYFMNEHVLRYLNLRVPHDYDTVPLVLFWGLCLVWMMPWSAFGFKATAWALPVRSEKWRSQFRRHDLPLKRRGRVLLMVWAAFVLLFFAFSTRQEYYVLPAFPAAAVLIAGWLALADNYRARVLRRGAQKRVVVQAGAHEEALRLMDVGRAAVHCTEVVLALGIAFAAGAAVILLHARTPAGHPDLARMLSEHPKDYAMSMGHFLDLNAEALGLFRLPLILAAVSLVLGPLVSLLLRKRARPREANFVLAAGAFGFLLAAHMGLVRFAPVISSAELAERIAPLVGPQDMVAIHGEYESGSTLGFYLQRPTAAGGEIHILEGRSSNLWYGSFFPDAPKIFETAESFRAKWSGPQRIFLWQSLTDPPNQLPVVDGPVYVIARGGGKEIVSNRPGD